MTWEPLSARLATLPYVLAGPVLRKVDETSVTVWLAMRIGATVELIVQDPSGTQLMTGERRTIAIGRNLHIVAVTATMLVAAARLSEGIVYRYNLSFALDNNTSCGLAEATHNARLGYPNNSSLPSFSLPPQDLNLLRLIQGSCRKPYGTGRDMLPHLHTLIGEFANHATFAYARPHQLLLTGDQIYADDVTGVLRLVLTDAAEALLGWDEQLPVEHDDDGRSRARDINAVRRYWNLTQAGFTSVDLRSHLLSLGEYLAMYLFVWSPVLWPPSLPTYQDAVAEIDADLSYYRDNEDIEDIEDIEEMTRDWKTTKSIEAHIASLQKFHQSLPNVRRALANVPSYMIFDDHEVTDDWNMTRDANRSMYGNDLGLRVIQNALIAFSICQHWGNVPERFHHPETGGPLSPGASLLLLLDTPNPTEQNAFNDKASALENLAGSFRKLLGIHEAHVLDGRDDHAVFHDSAADSLRYNFTVEGPSHQVIFTDTRTWRSYPKEKSNVLSGAPGTHLLTRNRQTDQFMHQILNAPATGQRLLLVVLTTNMPPVQPIRAATRHEWKTNHIKHFPDVYEAWDLPSTAFDRLLVALSSKLPLDASGQHAGAVVLLSGDVHHSFATRIIYRATERFEDDVAPKPATAVFAQLVTSALKNQDENTVGFQRMGYFAAPHKWLADRMIRHELTEAYVGWNFTDDKKHDVGSYHEGAVRIEVTRQTIDVTRGERVYDRPDTNRCDLRVTPHYRYRLDYLKPQITSPTPPRTIPPLPPGTSLEQRRAAAREYDGVRLLYQYLNVKNSPQVVGVNNLGEIRLQWGAPTQRTLNHILHWREAGTGEQRMTTYRVRLDLNSPTDPEFGDIKARTEP